MQSLSCASSRDHEVNQPCSCRAEPTWAIPRRPGALDPLQALQQGTAQPPAFPGQPRLLPVVSQPLVTSLPLCGHSLCLGGLLLLPTLCRCPTHAFYLACGRPVCLTQLMPKFTLSMPTWWPSPHHADHRSQCQHPLLSAHTHLP